MCSPALTMNRTRRFQRHSLTCHSFEEIVCRPKAADRPPFDSLNSKCARVMVGVRKVFVQIFPRLKWIIYGPKHIFVCFKWPWQRQRRRQRRSGLTEDDNGWTACLNSNQRKYKNRILSDHHVTMECKMASFQEWPLPIICGQRIAISHQVSLRSFRRCEMPSVNTADTNQFESFIFGHQTMPTS